MKSFTGVLSHLPKKQQMVCRCSISTEKYLFTCQHCLCPNRQQPPTTTLFVMNNKQSRKINMFTLVAAFFLKYTTILSTYLPLLAQIVFFTDQEKELQLLLNQQGYGSKGKTMSKESLRQALIALVISMAQKAKGWALTTNNKEMAEFFEIYTSDFKVKDNDFVTFIQIILQNLTANATALIPYNIIAANITTANALLTDFIEIKDSPKQQIDVIKTATGDIAKQIKIIENTLVITDTLIFGEFQLSHPEMVTEYNNNRTISNSVNRHTAIKAHVYSDIAHMHPVIDAEVSIISLNRTVHTSFEGEAEIVQFLGGSYLLSIVSPGYVKANIPFAVARAKHIEVDVVLKPTLIHGRVTNKGIPVAGYNVNIVGTLFSVTTDENGDYNIYMVLDGDGVLESSNEGGDSVSKPFTMVNGQTLRIDIAF